ncbi:hypothetical protein D9M69_606480 [compost metagenome]
MSVLHTPPTPPVNAVPPTNTAAIAGSRNSFARVGEPLDRRPAMTIPESAASPADRAKAMIFTCTTFTPEASAAGSPDPMALQKRPNAVRLCNTTQTSSTTSAISASFGIPAVVPVTQRK